MTAAIIPMDRAAVELAEARRVVREADTQPEYMVVRSALVLLARGNWTDAERGYAAIDALGMAPTDEELAATAALGRSTDPTDDWLADVAGWHPDLWSFRHPRDWVGCLVGVACGIGIVAGLFLVPYGFGWTP